MKIRDVAAVILLGAMPLCLGDSSPEPAAAVSPYEMAEETVAETEIDRLISEKRKALGLEPAPNCSDAVFVRRVFLDVIGTLPTAEEAESFFANRAPDKRAQLIEALLQRPEYAEYWALKWGDLLRVKSEYPINLWPNAVQAYHRWIRDSLRANVPYDQFARELLTSSGSNFREAPVNFYRAVQDIGPETIAGAVALTFLGMRVEKWPADRLKGMARFFEGIRFKKTGEWKEEIVYVDLFDERELAKSPASAVLPDGTAVALTPGKDPRIEFADWLTGAGNPFFARALANRAWCWLMGRGIVHEPDDFRPDNPPAHPELLAWLERELVRSGYDVKHLFRLILNSRAYQRSTVSSAGSSAGCFACYQVRRLDAEVLADAISRITGTNESYSSPIPEPFMFIPENARSIELPDGSISSSFLELFGRSPRDTGLEAERSNRATAAQALHLLNSSQLLRKLETGPRMQALAGPGRTPEQVVNGLYLSILSRFPTAEERQQCESWLASGRAAWRPWQGFSPRFQPGTKGGPQGGPFGRSERGGWTGPPVPEPCLDLAWSLINNPEFLFRH